MIVSIYISGGTYCRCYCRLIQKEIEELLLLQKSVDLWEHLYDALVEYRENRGNPTKSVQIFFFFLSNINVEFRTYICVDWHILKIINLFGNTLKNTTDWEYLIPLEMKSLIKWIYGNYAPGRCGNHEVHPMQKTVVLYIVHRVQSKSCCLPNTAAPC